MRFLKHRHLMSCSALFIISLYLFAHTGNVIRISIFAVAVCAVVGGIILNNTKYKANKQYIFLAVSILLATVAGAYTFSFKTDSVRESIGNTVELSVTVTEIKSSLPYMSELFVKYDGVGALLTCEYPLQAKAGDILSGEFSVSDFEEDINGYPEKDYQFSKGNVVHLYSHNDDLTAESGGDSLYVFFYNTRKMITAHFSSLLSEDSSSYLSCLLLGERDSLSPSLKSDFTDLGISHLLAISGMHLGILIGALIFILRTLSIHRSARNIICIIAIILFAALTAFPPSLTRAGIATIIILCCYFIRKRPDGATALTFAVAIIYLFDPYSVYDIGLTLSFMATLGIITVTPLIRKKTSGWALPKFVKYLFEGFSTTIIALTFTLPFTLTSFGTFTFLSIFTTVLFSPLICAALYLSPLVLIFGKIPYLGKAICSAAELLTEITKQFAAFLSKNLQFTVSCEYTFAKILVICFCIGFILLLLTAPKRPLLFILPICIFTVSIYSGAAIYNKINENKTFICIDETSRNDTLSLTLHGKTTVLDISGATSAPSKKALYSAKNEQYAVYIENYILVNRTYRTVSFAEKLLTSNRINNLYLPTDIMEDGEYDLILAAAEARGTQVHSYHFGDTIDLGKLKITANEPAHIKRSSMPIHNISIETERELIFYAGAAFSESSLTAPDADFIIAGSYGPLYKEDFSFDAENVIISDTAKDHYTGEGTVYEKVTNVILNND